MWTEARAQGAVMFVQGTLEKLHNVTHLGWFRMFRASGLPVEWGYLSLETGLLPQFACGPSHFASIGARPETMISQPLFSAGAPPLGTQPPGWATTASTPCRFPQGIATQGWHDFRELPGGPNGPSTTSPRPLQLSRRRPTPRRLLRVFFWIHQIMSPE